jgi:hypothetical protein
VEKFEADLNLLRAGLKAKPQTAHPRPRRREGLPARSTTAGEPPSPSQPLGRDAFGRRPANAP